LYPEDLKYSRRHQWARVEDNLVRVGITFYAQDRLGDIVFAELPEEGRVLEKDEPFGVVESVKAVADIFAPVSGKVIEVNKELPETPELMNQDPYGKGWMIVIEMSDPGELGTLLEAEQYRQFIEEEKP